MLFINIPLLLYLFMLLFTFWLRLKSVLFIFSHQQNERRPKRGNNAIPLAPVNYIGHLCLLTNPFNWRAYTLSETGDCRWKYVYIFGTVTYICICTCRLIRRKVDKVFMLKWMRTNLQILSVFYIFDLCTHKHYHTQTHTHTHTHAH